MRRRWIVTVAVLGFVGAAALGAVGDWVWWEPYRGLTITLAAGSILLVAIVLALIRGTRTTGLILAAVAVGLIAGQNLGPSRPELQQSAGTMTVTLTGPRATTGSVAITCAMDAVGVELSFSGDPNFRLDIVRDDPAVPADIDQREFFGVSMTVGDRWAQGSTPRSDRIVLTTIVGRVEADIPETRMRSAPTSTLELDRSATRGTLSFGGLVPETSADGAAGDPVDIAGTLTWDCEEGGAAEYSLAIDNRLDRNLIVRVTETQFEEELGTKVTSFPVGARSIGYLFPVDFGPLEGTIEILTADCDELGRVEARGGSIIDVGLDGSVAIRDLAVEDAELDLGPYPEADAALCGDPAHTDG